MHVTNIELEQLENNWQTGCSAGTRLHYTLTLNNGELVTGYTCPCLRGCHGADCIEHIDRCEFKSLSDLYDFLHS